jgi:hypothetical protein
VKQCFAEKGRENLHVRLLRNADRLTGHHLLIQAPDKRLGLVGWTSRLSLAGSLAKSQCRREPKKKDAPQEIHIAASGVFSLFSVKAARYPTFATESAAADQIWGTRPEGRESCVPTLHQKKAKRWGTGHLRERKSAKRGSFDFGRSGDLRLIS